MTTRNAIRILPLLIFAYQTYAIATGDHDDYPKLSPFTAVKWNDWTPIVQIDEQWYEFVSLNDLGVTRLPLCCRVPF